MRNPRLIAFLVGMVFSGPLVAQSTVIETRDGMEIRVRLDGNDPRVEEAGSKTVRVLAEHDLRPWGFTHEVVITSEGIPHSHPVLTLTTESEYFEDDLRQLSTFVHEQLHWFAADNEAAVERAIEHLRRRYPEVPVRGGEGGRSEYSTYLHLIVNWLELDAMVELVGRGGGAADRLYLRPLSLDLRSCVERR